MGNDLDKTVADLLKANSDIQNKGLYDEIETLKRENLMLNEKVIGLERQLLEATVAADQNRELAKGHNERARQLTKELDEVNRRFVQMERQATIKDKTIEELKAKVEATLEEMALSRNELLEKTKVHPLPTQGHGQKIRRSQRGNG